MVPMKTNSTAGSTKHSAGIVIVAIQKKIKKTKLEIENACAKKLFFSADIL